jgi:hypothetical protein
MAAALSAGVEAQLVDLLAPGSPPVSLKDGSATTALARLLHYQASTAAAPAAEADPCTAVRHAQSGRI